MRSVYDMGRRGFRIKSSIGKQGQDSASAPVSPKTNRKFFNRHPSIVFRAPFYVTVSSALLTTALGGTKTPSLLGVKEPL